MTIADSAAKKPTVNQRLKTVVYASMAGTVAEWYEFFLYATASTLVFGTLFFPQTGNLLDGIISALLIYAVGFFARPLGGLVFGAFGDLYGRKRLLQVSLLIVGVATFLMGCIPGFPAIGYWAPVILVVLRFLQGFGLGGEWGGAVLLVAETSPRERRGFWSSWPQAGVPAGNLLATLVLTVLSVTLSQEAFLSWGWRIAFWASALIVIIGYYIRSKVEDASIFQEQLEHAAATGQKRIGAWTLIRRYPRRVVSAMGMKLVENIFYYLIVTFSITYLKIVVEIDTTRVLLLVLIAHAVHFFAIPIVGHMADRVGRKPLYLTGAALAAVWGFAAWPLMATGDNVLIVTAITLGLIVHALVYAPMPAMMAELFPTRVRYTGVSIGYQVTSVIAGSFAPLIATALLNQYQSAIPIGFYLLAAAVISFVIVATTRETKGLELRTLDAEDARRYPDVAPAAH
ncbi:MFS transporter [Agromyces aerolatus]|uniref:MFS transporter n=1 Tax=Agromyces sp. LY-1074 TaxID=3074080 RepID=UPI00286373DB|nr:MULTISPECIES: MFS transporter [unclassified Agromyces]MDR5700958.1 MFS transporter [Agromyces sp. LY-1074]MDR5707381.1 MFS transporter [Agromyces sp. LY-1358]